MAAGRVCTALVHPRDWNEAIRTLSDGGLFSVTPIDDLDVTKHVKKKGQISMVVVHEEDVDRAAALALAVRELDKRVFVVIFSRAASASPQRRSILAENGAHMVTTSFADLQHVAKMIHTQEQERGAYTCPFCKMPHLTEDALWWHVPLYHVTEPNERHAIDCVICGKRAEPYFVVHLHNKHGPCARGEIQAEEKGGPPLYAFALVVCRRSDGRFLLVQEFAASGFWLPGGRIDAMEDVAQAAVRETKEEAGVDVELTGILRVAYVPHRGYVRFRVIFMARPVDDAALPKTIPDYESAGAVWASVEEIEDLYRKRNLRGDEPYEWCPFVAQGGYVAPMSILASESAPPSRVV